MAFRLVLRSLIAATRSCAVSGGANGRVHDFGSSGRGYDAVRAGLRHGRSDYQLACGAMVMIEAFTILIIVASIVCVMILLSDEGQ